MLMNTTSNSDHSEFCEYIDNIIGDDYGNGR